MRAIKKRKDPYEKTRGIKLRYKVEISRAYFMRNQIEFWGFIITLNSQKQRRKCKKGAPLIEPQIIRINVRGGTVAFFRTFHMYMLFYVGFVCIQQNHTSFFLLILLLLWSTLHNSTFGKLAFLIHPSRERNDTSRKQVSLPNFNMMKAQLSRLLLLTLIVSPTVGCAGWPLILVRTISD